MAVRPEAKLLGKLGALGEDTNMPVQRTSVSVANRSKTFGGPLFGVNFVSGRTIYGDRAPKGYNAAKAKWLAKQKARRLGSPPASRGSIHSAWTSGGGSSSRSEAARKAWRTRRGH